MVSRTLHDLSQSHCQTFACPVQLESMLSNQTAQLRESRVKFAQQERMQAPHSETNLARDVHQTLSPPLAAPRLKIVDAIQGSRATMVVRVYRVHKER